MTRIIFALAAFVATQSFAESQSCVLRQMLGTAGADCAPVRTSSTTVASATPTATPAAQSAGQVSCQAYDRCGRSCTDPNFGRSYCTAPVNNGQQLNWYQLSVLNWYYQAGWISPEQLAQILYQSADYNTQLRFQILNYYYGYGSAVDDLLANYGFGGSYYGLAGATSSSVPGASRSYFGQSSAFQQFLRNAFFPTYQE